MERRSVCKKASPNESERARGRVIARALLHERASHRGDQFIAHTTPVLDNNRRANAAVRGWDGFVVDSFDEKWVIEKM